MSTIARAFVPSDGLQQYLAATGNYGLGRTEVLELYEAKFAMKETKVQELKERKYNTCMKEDKEGITAMDKARMYDIVLKEIDSAPDKKNSQSYSKNRKEGQETVIE